MANFNIKKEIREEYREIVSDNRNKKMKQVVACPELIIKIESQDSNDIVKPLGSSVAEDSAKFVSKSAIEENRTQIISSESSKIESVERRDEGEIVDDGLEESTYVSEEGFKRHMIQMFPKVSNDIIDTFKREFCGLCGARFDTEKRAWTHYFSSEHNHALKKDKRFLYPPFWKMIKLALADFKSNGASKKNMYDFMVQNYPGVKSLRDSEIYDRLGRNLVEMVTQYQNVYIDTDGKYRLGRPRGIRGHSLTEKVNHYFKGDHRYSSSENANIKNNEKSSWDVDEKPRWQRDNFQEKLLKRRDDYLDKKVRDYHYNDSYARDIKNSGNWKFAEKERSRSRLELKENLDRGRSSKHSEKSAGGRYRSRSRSRSRSHRGERRYESQKGKNSLSHVKTSRERDRSRSYSKSCRGTKTDELNRKNETEIQGNGRIEDQNVLSSRREENSSKIEKESNSVKLGTRDKESSQSNLLNFYHQMQMSMIPMQLPSEGNTPSPIILVPSNIAPGTYPEFSTGGALRQNVTPLLTPSNLMPTGYTLPTTGPNLIAVPQANSLYPSPPLSITPPLPYMYKK